MIQWIKNIFSKSSNEADLDSLTQEELEELLIPAIFAAIKDGTFTSKHLDNKWVRKYFAIQRLNK